MGTPGNALVAGFIVGIVLTIAGVVLAGLYQTEERR